MAQKSDEIRGNTFKSTELDALEETINICTNCFVLIILTLSFIFCEAVPLPTPMIHDLHAALAGSGMIFVTPHIICVN
jgi:hypothetical protein